MSRSLKSQTLAGNVELALVLASTVLVSILSIRFDWYESLSRLVAQHDEWQLDEMVIILTYLGFALSFTVYRRERALRREMRRREASEALATRLARHDPLTGLPNRRVLSEELEAAIASVEESAAECAIFLIDLDLFKPVNDIHGHGVGDAVLIETAARITAIIGAHGMVARMGGDEFACVVSYPSGRALPARLAARLLRGLGQPIRVRSLQVRIGATIGIARAPQDGICASALLHCADLAMYQGKREGRGVYHFFHEEMDIRLRERAALEADLRLAVGAGEIIPHFQPVMDLKSNHILGFEALARWTHPTRGLVAPDVFIPIAEDLGIIDEISYAILRASCAAAGKWPASFWLSVNISPLQLRDPWLAARLLAILTEAGFAPGRLIVEVTENAVIEDMVRAREIFASLQSAGVRIALDDFGKGYSSLYHLRQLQFDQLKIDGSFVHSMNSPESAKIVSAVAGLGKSLGMPVTAEGVETSEEADALRALGCEHAQGFLFGKPLDAADTMTLLDQSARSRVHRLPSAR
jgi:diguanylate cyclase (GGDEF)-like protein